MTLPEAIHNALPPDDRMRIGIISSIAPVTVDVQGTSMPGNAVGSYTPILGDNVAVLRQDQTWLILGKTSSANTGTTGPVSQAGEVLMSVSAAGSAVVTVDFRWPFTRTPAVCGNINSGAGPTASWAVRCININTTAFQLFIFGPVNTFTAAVQWQAREYTQ